MPDRLGEGLDLARLLAEIATAMIMMIVAVETKAGKVAIGEMTGIATTGTAGLGNARGQDRVHGVRLGGETTTTSIASGAGGIKPSWLQVLMFLGVVFPRCRCNITQDSLGPAVACKLWHTISLPFLLFAVHPSLQKNYHAYLAELEASPVWR